MIKQQLLLNLKNIYGWKTKRKIVVFSIDDYGNVRVDSKQARRRMDQAGLKILSRFDVYDALETTEDLEALYETLSSVKDKNGKAAVFTPFALPCNIDFEKMAASNYEAYFYELLPETYAKLKGYENTWTLWQEGIDKGLMKPQFHGREHFNLKVFKEKLDQKDQELLIALKNRSNTSISKIPYSSYSYTAAFGFWNLDEMKQLNEIAIDGLRAFEQVYGYSSDYFNAPAGKDHPLLYATLMEKGIRYIDVPLIKNQHLGEGKYTKEINYTGKKNNLGQVYIVRNVVFEPTDDRGLDWVNFTLQQIEAAFRWNRPAIISSHRVNFCGHIDENNRRKGISTLKELLKKITQRWPDVEFMAADELGDLISNN